MLWRRARDGESGGRPRTAPELYRKLLALTGVRLLVGFGLLGATALVTLDQGFDLGRRVEGLLYGIVASIFLGSLVSGFLLRAGRFLRGAAWAQIAFDILSATGLVYLTGCAESIFTILYPLAIVNGAIALSRKGARFAAAGSIAAFGLLVFATERGLLAFTPFTDRPPLALPHLVLTLAANLSAFVLTAALASHLAEQLQGTQHQLAVKETELSVLSELHGSIVRSVGTGILAVDASGRISFVNPAGEEICGVAEGGLAGALLEERLPELDRALRRADPGRGEARVRTASGAERIVGYSVAKLVDREGAGRHGSVIVFQDLTNLRRMEEAMRRSERLAALGKLAAGLAHEIRNPLTSMSGSIELISESARLGPTERRLLGIVLRESERLESLLKDFLSLARPAQVQSRPLDARDVLQELTEVFGPAAQARGIALQVDVPRNTLVLGDAAQLRQVFWNLLNNAAEATGRGGTIRVAARTEGGQCVLEFADSGSGIAEEDLPRIFDPFFTNKERGTGLGLAFVASIVAAHGGHVDVKSRAGEGSAFSVYLPRAVAEPAEGARGAG